MKGLKNSWDNPETFPELSHEKRQTCKPGSVSVNRRTFIIYLAQISLPESCSLPLLILLCVENETGRFAVPQQRQTIRIYMALQPVRHTADDVATTTGALLPHLFTRSLKWTRQFRVVIFCYVAIPFQRSSR